MLVLHSLSFPLHETIWISDRQRNVVLFQEQSLYSPFACFFFELGQKRKNLAKSAFCYSKKKQLTKENGKPQKMTMQCLFYLRMKKQINISKPHNNLDKAGVTLSDSLHIFLSPILLTLKVSMQPI